MPQCGIRRNGQRSPVTARNDPERRTPAASGVTRPGLAADLGEKGPPGGGGEGEHRSRAVGGVPYQDASCRSAYFDAGSSAVIAVAGFPPRAYFDAGRTAVVAVAGLAPAGVRCWLFHRSSASWMTARDSSMVRA
jgi:hypothetical protein